MNNLLLLGIVIISLIIFNNNYKLHSVQAVPNVGDINVVDTIPDNSFVKPQHKLLELLNNVSSADKLYLVNVVSRNSFTKSTLSEFFGCKGGLGFKIVFLYSFIKIFFINL